mmetsp:Transcript_14772/g.36145  ORF Transcript_14772/g.36145 Transcript_14772/m.36145 type:complete len:669 (-) Transcript_14772:1136-3142(-)
MGNYSHPTGFLDLPAVPLDDECKHYKEYFDVKVTCACEKSEEPGCERMNGYHQTTITSERESKITATCFHLPDDFSLPTHSTSGSREAQMIQKKQAVVQQLVDLLTNVVSHMNPQPTIIVMNGRNWPIELTNASVGKILEAAYRSTMKSGTVVWRGGSLAEPVQIDKAVEMWSYHLPWLVHQLFPKVGIREVSNSKNSYFLSRNLYQKWNEELISILEYTAIVHRVFILVGGARTMESTMGSYFANFIMPLCPKHNCIAHLVIHLSSSDNRPSRGRDDPLGTVVSSQDANIDKFLQNAPSNLILHKVKGYNIGSSHEASAMDLVEAETTDSLLRVRLRLFRYGDPRRYSMWFARAWAWRTVEILSETYQFQFLAFTRPDLLWLTPINTAEFFKKFSEEAESDVWVHDVYFSNVPDTLALFNSINAAKQYFSLEWLVQPGIACLGGPNFNESLVAPRLTGMGIQTNESDWCKNILPKTGNQGWSESILRRKLKVSGLKTRYFSAGSVILRNTWRPRFGLSTLSLVCNSLNPSHHISVATTNPNITGVPFVGCAQLARDIESRFPVTSLANFSLELYQPFSLQSQKDTRECLTLDDHMLQKAQCHSFDPGQVFTSSLDHQIVGLSYTCFRKSLCPKDAYIIPSNAKTISVVEGTWEKVPVHLNSVYPYRN